eukprot:scaffold5028_cov381-Prasinococcus_capsulatus_cf.AAC.1
MGGAPWRHGVAGGRLAGRIRARSAMARVRYRILGTAPTAPTFSAPPAGGRRPSSCRSRSFVGAGRAGPRRRSFLLPPFRAAGALFLRPPPSPQLGPGGQ